MSDAVKRPRAEVLAIAGDLLSVLEPTCFKIEVAGSIRRGCSEVGDIELVAIPRIDSATVKDPGDLFGATKNVERNQLWDQLDMIAGRSYTKCGPKSRQFVYRGVKVDLYTADAQNWGLILLIRTGSWVFSRHVVTQLRDRGTPSVDGRVRKGPEVLPTPTEEAVFSLAGMSVYHPTRRNWTQ